MKDVVKCYRSIGGIAEPVKCLGEQCSAWINSKNIKGCVFVIEAITSIIRNLAKGDWSKEEIIKDADEKETPTVVHTSAGETTCEAPKEQLEPGEFMPGKSTSVSAGETGFKTIDDSEYKGDKT